MQIISYTFFHLIKSLLSFNFYLLFSTYEFNYDVYSGDYQNSNNIEKNKKNKKIDEPIIIEDKNVDYNFKEDYEFKRQERHKFNKCWNCGKENRVVVYENWNIQTCKIKRRSVYTGSNPVESTNSINN